MYKSKYDEEFKEESSFIKRNLIWILLFFAVIGGISWFLTRASRTIDSAFVNYEQFQEIHNTCAKINTDLGVIRAVDENDRMFESFSKAAMIANKQQQLTRWIEEYNAKSKMWHRSMWKSNELPYQLEASQFNNFNE